MATNPTRAAGSTEATRCCRQSIRMPLGEAVVKDVQLLPGDEFPAPEKGIAQLVIALSDVQLLAGKEKIQEDIGGVAWIPSEKAEKLTTKGTQPARFVVVELQ